MLRISLPSTLLAATLFGCCFAFAGFGAAEAQAQCASCQSGQNHSCQHCREGLLQKRQNRHCPNCQQPNYGRPDLFYNLYADPTCGGVPAQMYISPRPVPAHVGHTYNTYQPLMPHELLYRHRHTYHRYYNDGRGLTRTRAIYW